MNREWVVESASAPTGHKAGMDSLENCRRTANAGVGEFQPGMGFNELFLQEADCREQRTALDSTICRAGAVRHQTD